jgi:protein-disulfide isomerase
MRPARPLPTLLLAASLLLGGCDRGPRQEAATDAPAAGGIVSLRDVGYELGSVMAPVTVIEFSDFGCPYCALFARETLPELKREFVETGQVRWQYVPFVLGIFQNGEEAARTSECAGEQDRFWPMHDHLYERQREWRGSGSPEALFLGYAAALDLDEDAFARCFRENLPRQRIERSNQLAAAVGVRATPTFVVNGRPIEGALPLDQFRLLLQWAAGQ